MYARLYDCLGTCLCVVYARTRKQIDKLIDSNWNQEVTSASVFKDNGDLIKVVYPYER